MARGATAVAAGILASRVAGLVRSAATAAAFGVGPIADVFQVALRAPNALQNLLGEQALSASFIPAYSKLLAAGDRGGARRLAGAAFGLLAATVTLLVAAGVLLARPIVSLLSPGYLRDADAGAAGSRLELAIDAVHWIFPMTGLLVLSAWALGVLNSHRRFLLPYLAPVFWNLAIVAALAIGWRTAPPAATAAELGAHLLIAAAIGAFVGGALQLGVQLPSAIGAIGGLRPSFALDAPGVRSALAALGPALAGRGVVQLSAYLDLILASFLLAGAQSALGYAQQLYLLPIGLFASSIAAASLPELARRSGDADPTALAGPTRALLARLAFAIVPATALLVVLGAPLVSGLYRLLPGRFGDGDAALVALVLAAYAVGLPASASSRLLQSTFFALGDTATPARTASLRVVISTAVALPLMVAFDRIRLSDLPLGATFDSDPALGALGLATGASVGAWFERLRLGRSLTSRIGAHVESAGMRARRAAAAAVALVPAAAIGFALSTAHPTVRAAGLGATFLVAYLVLGVAFGLRGSDSALPARLEGLIERLRPRR